MLNNFPKSRIDLPEDYKKLYNEMYKKNREGETTASSLSQKMESWLHRKIAKDLVNNIQKSTLEIGAGTLNQLKYENTSPYDIVEPFKELYQNSPYLSKIRNIFNDIDEIGSNAKYDRITSIATFEHILDLPKVVAKSCLLLNEKGTLRVSIPNEGNFLWTLGWKMTTGLEFRIKYKLDYGVIMKHEHLNNANEIEEVLKLFFTKLKRSVFGITKHCALYRFYECMNPKIEFAENYLQNI